MTEHRGNREIVCIVDKSSLTAAADGLDTSLPSMVRTLAALERELGVRLLNRTTRRLHLTNDGAQYLEHCRAILSAVQDVELGLSSRQAEPRGKLAVTALVLFGGATLPRSNVCVEQLRQVSFD